MPTLEELNGVLIGLGEVENPNQLTNPDSTSHNRFSQSHWFSGESHRTFRSDDNNQNWNNSKLRNESRDLRLTNSNINNNKDKVEFYNDINRRLTLDFRNSSNSTFLTAEKQLKLSRNSPICMIVSPEVLPDYSTPFQPSKFQRHHKHSSNPISYPSSSLDVVNMGKIQEFREKVGVSQVSMPKKNIWKCLTAEFLGTFLLVLLGCGSTLELPKSPPPTLVGTALCFAFVVSTLATTIGHVSGCHINPAVTLAMLVTGKIQLVKALLYVAVQCVAAIVAIAVLQALSPSETFDGKPLLLEFGYTQIAPKLTSFQGFGVEFLLTFLLVFVIFAVSDENRTDLKESGALSIGLALLAIILYGGPLTGAGLNPARVLGPCVILDKFENHWVYWIGPMGGAVTAAAVYQLIFRALRPDEVEAAKVAFERKVREREAAKDNGISPQV